MNSVFKYLLIKLSSDLTYTHSRSILGITTLALITLGPRIALTTNEVTIDLQGLEKDTLVYLYNCFRYSNSYLEFMDCVGQLVNHVGQLADLLVFLGELSVKMVLHLSIGSLGEDKLVYFLH